MPPFNDFLEMNGVTFSIERNGTCVGSIDGLPNHDKLTHKAYVGFAPGTDIQENDWLINNANERFLVIEKQTQYVHGEQFCIEAYTITEYEYHKNMKSQNNQPTFNIKEVHNSIVGTQNSATLTNGYSIDAIAKLIENHNTDDKELLKEMLSVLDNAVSNQEPVKKGLLSKFSDVLQRNEWITAPIATLVLEKFLL